VDNFYAFRNNACRRTENSLNIEGQASFLKWAGGKRWLVSRFSTLFPDTFENYYEPFVGSGSVFFWLRPERGLISDANAELVNLCKALKKPRTKSNGY